MTPATTVAPSKSASVATSANALPDAATGVFASLLAATDSPATKVGRGSPERGETDAERAAGRRRDEPAPDDVGAALTFAAPAAALAVPTELTSKGSVADAQGAAGATVSKAAGVDAAAPRRSAEAATTPLFGKSTAVRTDGAATIPSPVAAAPVQATTLAAALQQQVVGTAEPASDTPPDAAAQSGDDGPTLEAPAPLAPPAGAKSADAGSSGEGSAGEGKSGGKAAQASSEAKPDVVKPSATDVPAPKAERGDADSAPSNRAADPAPSSDRAAASTVQGQAAAPQSATAASTATAAPQLSSATAVAVAAQVATAVASHASQRRTRFEVRLDPGELGRVDVRLDIGHDGRVATRLVVEKAETLDLLRNDARELARMLEQAGFQLGQGGLAFQMKDGRRDDWRDGSQDGAAGRADAAGETDDVAPAPAAYARVRPAVGGVDRTV